MVFSSGLFLLYFFPVFLILYFVTPWKYKNYLALAASLLFYGWGAPRFIFIVGLSIIIDFFITRIMSDSDGMKRKVFLSLSVILNIGLLLYFKYANFFIESNIYFYSSLILTVWRASFVLRLLEVEQRVNYQ